MNKNSGAESDRRSNVFDFEGISQGLEPARLMDRFTNTLGEYPIPGVVAKAMVQGNRKNIEALAAANKQALEGYQAVLVRQGEILESALKDAKASLDALVMAGGPQDLAARQAEFVKRAMEHALEEMRYLAETVMQSNADAFDTIRKRIAESLTEIKALGEESKD